MKILFVHPSVELYGADKILLYILQILNNEKNDITVLLPNEGVLIEYIKKISSNITIIVDKRLPIAHSKLGLKDYCLLPKRIRKIEKVFKNNSFDYIYCNTLAVTLLLFTNWSKKRIIHVHEIIENPILNFIFSVLVRIRTRKVICVSNRVKENLHFSKHYSVVHNGIPDEAKHVLQNEVGDTIQFVLPGRYMPKKGQWFVLDALHLLPQEYLSKIHISFFGSAPPNRKEFQCELENKIYESGLSNVVSLHAFEKDISKIYIKANVILVPSLMPDPFPTTVLESLMFSRPVISTNHGGAAEILSEKYSFLISPNDIEALAAALRFFVDNCNQIPRMSEFAREKYEDYLTEQKFAQRFKTIFTNY